jgi:hypothetical protein
VDSAAHLPYSDTFPVFSIPIATSSAIGAAGIDHVPLGAIAALLRKRRGLQA